jgi:hypothetical protein
MSYNVIRVETCGVIFFTLGGIVALTFGVPVEGKKFASDH